MHTGGAMNTDSERIGRLDERMKALERDMSDVDKKLGQILDTLSEARGGWRTLMWLGGAAAALGGFVAWALQHIRWTP